MKWTWRDRLATFGALDLFIWVGTLVLCAYMIKGLFE